MSNNWADETEQDDDSSMPAPPSAWGKISTEAAPLSKIMKEEQTVPPRFDKEDDKRGSYTGGRDYERKESYDADRSGGRDYRGDGGRDSYRGDSGRDSYRSEGGRDSYDRNRDDRRGGRDNHERRNDYGDDRRGERRDFGGDRRGGDYGREQREERPPRPSPSEIVWPTEPPFAVYAGNISFDATDDDLGDFFHLSGCLVKSVFIVKDRDSGRPRGHAYVHFEDIESLQKAVELDGSMLAGRPVRVNVEQQKERPKREQRGGFFQNNFSNDRDFKRGDRDFNRRDKRRDEDRDRERDDDHDEPRQRPQLNLMKRSIPVEEKTPASNTLRESSEESVTPGPKANPFGAAKPRDEAAYQRKLEEKAATAPAASEAAADDKSPEGRRDFNREDRRDFNREDRRDNNRDNRGPRSDRVDRDGSDRKGFGFGDKSRTGQRPSFGDRDSRDSRGGNDRREGGERRTFERREGGDRREGGERRTFERRDGAPRQDNRSAHSTPAASAPVTAVAKDNKPKDAPKPKPAAEPKKASGKQEAANKFAALSIGEEECP